MDLILEYQNLLDVKDEGIILLNRDLNFNQNNKELLELVSFGTNVPENETIMFEELFVSQKELCQKKEGIQKLSFLEIVNNYIKDKAGYDDSYTQIIEQVDQKQRPNRHYNNYQIKVTELKFEDDFFYVVRLIKVNENMNNFKT